MQEYFTCNMFSEQDINFNGKFKVVQKELTPVNENELGPRDITYDCVWVGSKQIDNTKPFVVIPIRDNPKLLKFTLSNFKKANFFNYVNVVIVDDRSEEDLHTICKEYNTSYLKMDNDKGFSFSMLNNVAAYIAKRLGGEKVIFWNSDLWIDKISYFKKLISKHNSSGATISGSKLLYPHKSLHDDDHSVNIKTHFPNKTDGSYKGTVQFGNCRWLPMQMQAQDGAYNAFIPIHYKRFADKSDPCVNCDTGTEFVTGALQVVDLNWFIENGGYNPSLPKVFQDVDLCLRAITQGKKVMYFGKDIHFYHDESYNHFSNKNQEKIDTQFHADSTLFGRIWRGRIEALIL
jgi:GT2 family glycosyltransferase